MFIGNILVEETCWGADYETRVLRYKLRDQEIFDYPSRTLNSGYRSFDEASRILGYGSQDSDIGYFGIRVAYFRIRATDYRIRVAYF